MRARAKRFAADGAVSRRPLQRPCWRTKQATASAVAPVVPLKIVEWARGVLGAGRGAPARLHLVVARRIRRPPNNDARQAPRRPLRCLRRQLRRRPGGHAAPQPGARRLAKHAVWHRQRPKNNGFFLSPIASGSKDYPYGEYEVDTSGEFPAKFFALFGLVLFPVAFAVGIATASASKQVVWSSSVGARRLSCCPLLSAPSAYGTGSCEWSVASRAGLGSADLVCNRVTGDT